MHKGIFVAGCLALGLGLGMACAQEAKLMYPDELIPRLNIPHMSKAPVIDGKIDPEEWREAVRVTGMVSTHSLDFRDRPVWFWVAWDEQHLYLATRSDILPGHRLYRASRERYTTNAVFDDAFEFGVFMHDRNKKEGEVSSFLKFILTSLGSGEYMKIYPSIGQNMYNWQPDSKVANTIYEADGKKWWDMEVAMDLAALEMPVPNKAGDKVGLLLAADLKNPGWQWLDFPSATGHLVHHGFPRTTLTTDQPYVQIERCGGLHDEKLELKSLICNPADVPATVTVSASVTYTPPKEAKEQPRVVVDEKQTLTVPAKGTVRFDLEKAFPGLTYTFTKWGSAENKSRFSLTVKRGDAPAELAPVYTYTCDFAGTDKKYLQADTRTTVFEYDMQFNPVTNRILLAGDTLDAAIPTESKIAALTYAIDKDGAVIKEGRITQFVHLKYEDVVDLPAIASGKYRVTLTFVDADGKALVSRNDISFEKKDEAKEFAGWWNNRIGDTEKVLTPFEPLKVKSQASGAIIACTRREYDLDGLGLPRQIVANDGNVLTRPAQIVVTVGGKEQAVPTKGKLTITDTKDWRIEFTGDSVVAGIAFSVKGWMEQDGLVNLALTYAPESRVASRESRVEGAGTGVPIEDLRVEWPVDDRLGSWMSCIGGVGGNYAPRTIGKVPAGQGAVWDTLSGIGKAGSTMVIGNWENNLWIGNEIRGFLWCADNDRGWVPNDRTPAHSLLRDGTTLVLRNHLINLPRGEKPFVLDAPRTVHLQYNATPFRHFAKGWRLTQVSAANGFAAPDYKTNEKTKKEYFSILSMPSTDVTEWPEYYAKYKAKAEAKAKGGGYSIGPRLTTFLTNQIALRGYMDKTVEPGLYDYFRADWVPGNESLNKSYTDYMIYLMNRHVREGGVTHYYFDISFSRDTANPVAGFGYRLADGRVQPGSMDGALRDWYKRVWALMLENNLYPGGVSGHATNSICLRALPWADAILDSEYPMPEPILTYPPDRMIAMSCPHSFGVNISHLGFMNPYWAAMHDAGTGGGGGPLHSDAFRHFGIAADDVAFVPYWRNGELVKQAGQGLFVSTWKRPHGAILAVMNYGLDPQGTEKMRTGDVTLDLRKLGIPRGAAGDQVRVTELDTDERILPDRYLSTYAWLRELPDAPHPRGWKDHKVKLRPPVTPQLDLATGKLGGFDIFYHDVRFVLITWDDKAVADSGWKDLFSGADGASVLNWGIARAETKALSAQELTECVTTTDPMVQTQAWKQPGTVLLRVVNTGGKATDATLILDLGKLGVKVAKRWAAYTQCLGGTLDAETGALTVKGLKPGAAALVYVDTF